MRSGNAWMLLWPCLEFRWPSVPTETDYRTRRERERDTEPPSLPGGSMAGGLAGCRRAAGKARRGAARRGASRRGETRRDEARPCRGSAQLSPRRCRNWDESSAACRSQIRGKWMMPAPPQKKKKMYATGCVFHVLYYIFLKGRVEPETRDVRTSLNETQPNLT